MPMDATRPQISSAEPDDPSLYYTIKPDHHISDYARGGPELVNLLSEADGRKMAALILSFSLVAKIRVAICSGYKYRHVKEMSDAGRDNQQTIDAESRLLEVEIERLQERVKSVIIEDQRKNDEVKLLTAIKKQKELRCKLTEEEAKGRLLDDSTSHARHLFESNWAAIDSDLRCAFEKGGFEIDSPSSRATMSNNRILYPPQPKGYSANQVFVPHRKIRSFLPGLVNLAGADFQKARKDFHKWHEEFDVEAAKAAHREGQPYRTEKDKADFNALWRMEWHKENAVYAQKRVAAREKYSQAHKVAKFWHLDDVASWPSETWISMGPEEETRHSQAKDLTRTRNWVNSLKNMVPDTSRMTPWAGPKFPSADGLGYTEPLIPDYSGTHHIEPDPRSSAMLFPDDSASHHIIELLWPPPGSVTNESCSSVDTRLFNPFHRDHNRRDEVKHRYGYYDDRLNYGTPLGCAEFSQYNLEKHTKNYPAETPTDPAIEQDRTTDFDALIPAENPVPEDKTSPHHKTTKKDQLEAYKAQREAKRPKKRQVKEVHCVMQPGMEVRCRRRVSDIQKLLELRDIQKAKDKENRLISGDPSEDRNHLDAWSDAGSSTYSRLHVMRSNDYRRRENYLGTSDCRRWERYMNYKRKAPKSRTPSEHDRGSSGTKVGRSSSGSDTGNSVARKSKDRKRVHNEEAVRPATEDLDAQQGKNLPQDSFRGNDPIGTIDQEKSDAGAKKPTERPSGSDPDHLTKAPVQRNNNRHKESQNIDSTQRPSGGSALTRPPGKDRNLDLDETEKSRRSTGAQKSAKSPSKEKRTTSVATENSAESFGLEDAMITAAEASSDVNQTSNTPAAAGTKMPPVVTHSLSQSGGSRPRNPSPTEDQDEYGRQNPATKRKRADDDDDDDDDELLPRRNMRPKISTLDSDIHTRHAQPRSRTIKSPPRPRSGGFTRVLLAQTLFHQSPEDTDTIHRTMVPVYDVSAELPTAMDIDSEDHNELSHHFGI